MSKLRPELHSDPNSKLPMPDTFDALWMIRDSVERRQGLIHGKLKDPNGVCAIGAFFDDNNLCLSTSLVDEVAAYNDSIPRVVSNRERRNRVLRWLTARLEFMRGRIGPRLEPIMKQRKRKAS